MTFREMLGGDPKKIDYSPEWLEATDLELLEGEVGLLYPNGCHIIQITGPAYYVLICNTEEVFDKLEDAEKHLVENWAIPEGLTVI